MNAVQLPLWHHWQARFAHCCKPIWLCREHCPLVTVILKQLLNLDLSMRVAADMQVIIHCVLTAANRVGCGGSVAGPERRQGDGGGRAGPHSAPGGPRTEPRGSLKLANGAVPTSAWKPRAGGDKRGSGGRKSPRLPPTPLGSDTPLPGKDRGRHRGSTNKRSGHGSPAHTHGRGAGSCKVKSGPGARVRDPAGKPDHAGAWRPTLQTASGREVGLDS